MKIQLSMKEITDLIVKAKTDDDKIKIILDNNSVALRTLLRIVYDNSLVWNIPTSPPPYKKSIHIDLQGALHREYKKLPYFFIVSNLKQAQRESMFIQLLESIHADDSDFIINHALLKKPIRTLKKELLLEKMPGIFT